MTWLAWRQFRVSAVFAAAALAVMAILLALTTLHSVASCGSQQSCAITTGKFLGLSHDHLLKYLSTVLVVVPALIGAFWGAPLLARELEAGTYRLAWTQSVTRSRWLATKLGVLGLASVAVTGLFSLMLTRWSTHAINLGRFSSAMFDERGIAPMGDAVFGFALGVTLGLLIRRVVPAMAATLVGFAAARFAVAHWVLPHFATPLRLSASFAAQFGPGFRPTGAGDWMVSNNLVSPNGHVVTVLRCPPPAPPPGIGGTGPSDSVVRVGQSCGAHYRNVISYQPASRYWSFQVYDVALFVGIALILLGFSFWWVRRRIN